MAEPLTLVVRTGIGGYLFPFLLVFALVYAVLAKTKLTGEKSDINAIIALTVAFVTILSDGARLFVIAFIPYAALLFVILFLGIFMFAMFGAGEKEISSLLTHSTFYYPLLIIFIIMVFVIMGSHGLFSDPAGTAGVVNGDMPISGPGAFRTILGSPLVLGLIVMLVLMALGTYMIIKPPKVKKDQ